jgi:hypothetical protein
MNSPTGRRGPLDYSSRVRKRRAPQGRPPVPAMAPEERARQGRALTRYIPASIKKRIRGGARRSAYVILGIFAAFLIAGALVLALAYARLNQGPISLRFVVPPIERAVNSELSGFRFRIGGAVMKKADSGPGVEFRLKNVSLVDKNGDPIIEAPFASINLSAWALVHFRLAAAHVDLIGPRLFLQFSEQDGLAVAFSRSAPGGAGTAAETRDEAGGAGGGWMRRADGPAMRSANPPSANVADRRHPPSPDGSDGLGARAQSINIATALGNFFDQIRNSGSVSYLSSFGVVNAAVYLGDGPGESEWRIQQASIELGHAATLSRIQGEASIDSGETPWKVSFSAQQKPNRLLSFTAAVHNVVPRAIAANFPALDILKVWNMPVNIRSRFDVAADGALTFGSASVALSAGQIYAPWEQKHPASIDEAKLDVEYVRKEGVLRILPSSMRWGASHLSLRGEFRRVIDSDGSRRWKFDIGSNDIELAAEKFSLPAIPVDEISVKGSVAFNKGEMILDRLSVRAADAFAALQGSVRGFNDAQSPSVSLAGTISPMPVAFFKLIWPETVAHGGRKWVGKHVHAGRITGGQINVNLPKGAISALVDGRSKLPDSAVDVKMGVSSLVLSYLTGAPPVSIPRATAVIVGQRFMLDVPDAAVSLPSGENIRLSDGQFIIGDLSIDPQIAEVHFKAQGKAGAVLELLDHEPLGYVRKIGLTPDIASGSVNGSFSVTIPMLEDVEFKQLKLAGKAHYQDARLNMALDGYSVHGGAIAFDLSEKALEAQGEVKVNGVPVKLSWRRIFDEPADKQPPLRAAAVFDGAAREKLGLPINHVVRGPVPAEVAVFMKPKGPPSAHFEANLTKAELFLSLMGRRKPPGERTVLSFDAILRPDGGAELENFKLAGKEIGVTGSITLNEKKKPSAFRFPNFSFNILSKLEVSGALTESNVWKINAKGASFDAREFYRSLFSAGKLSEDQPTTPKDSPGVDVHAEIDTVLGYFETNLKNVAVDVRKRGDKIVFLDVHGRLNGTAPIMTRIEGKPGGSRMLVGETTDGGAAFRLIGLYPSMRGGLASLRVRLDGSRAGEKSGVLYVRKFNIVGDQVVGEVLANTPRTIQRKRRRARNGEDGEDDYEASGGQINQMEFNHLKAPFRVGHGQFELRDAAINGPLFGATLRGKYDFTRQYVDLSGTYVPLYGINGAFYDFPLIGPLLGGRNGEGVFGVTFAIQGSINRPIQPQINPLSVVAPGFLRQIFEFDPPPSRMAPQNRKASGADARSRRSSSFAR